ncbi:Excitatory amino acid transporter 5 Retinal glutamate transporter Solute carrier family 1 member 7 [Channa argus]|uniref:Amino acid transporter n=1 Tax=Channa argus TaxID=215402 RepID=A0A6G1QF06_CHAAH|nr:Excitatory amino acid transporter 5 Retinal glutamate transporter Solute carrier family 1 member 7 [Channa argus]
MESSKNLLKNMVSVKIREYVKDYCKRNGLLTLSVFAVVTGCVLGFILRSLNLSTQAKIYFSFPGELLMRMLKMLILPLITSSLMSGLSAMDTKASGRLGVLTITYYLWTTFIAVIVGIVLVLIIHPGTGSEIDGHHASSGPVMTSADALLDLIRNMIPSNLIEATFQQYRTDLVPIVQNSDVKESQANYVYVMPDYHNPHLGHPVFLEITPAPDVKYKIVPSTSKGMNVLGIVIFSATMGLLLGKMGERGAPLVNVCQCINEYFPFGIVFLVAGKILDMHDPAHLGEKLGMYFITVLCGLFVHGLILLPLFFFFFTRKNPFPYIRGLLQALVIALATSSSSATLPITMKCLLENCGVDRQIARFVLPVGATINMDGTALYEAVAAIFIAQVNEYDLDFGQLVTISITATAASIGAAGIPQAGLVTMVIVLTSVGLPPADISLIVAIDWVLDRFRTMINVLGDALAAGIMAHICKKDFDKAAAAAAAAATVAVNANNGGGPKRRDTVISFGNQSVALSDVPLIAHRCDYVFEVDGDNVLERPMACYNLCHV